MMGVYQIVCKSTGKRYIGSSVDIDNRWVQHKCDLRAGRHVNKHLQNAWNKYGCDDFFWGVIELADDRDCLLDAEQKWLDNTCPELNGTLNAFSPMLGKKATEEHKRKIGLALKGRVSNRKGAKMSPEARAKISESLKGNSYAKGYKHSEKTRIKNSEAQKKRHRDKPVSEETRRKLSEANKGKRLVEETKKKISDRMKDWHLNNENPMKGRKRPDLAERNRRNAKK